MKWRIAACIAVATLTASIAAFATLPTEKVDTVQSLPKSNGHRVFITDLVLAHATDGKLHIVDGDSLNYLGQLATGYAGMTTLAPDGAEIYVATTYYTRLNRGERVDEVDIYDALTLKLLSEIPLPPKRALSLPYNSLMAVSADDRWLFVQNLTPASSISVVDLKARRFVKEVATPGCYALFSAPSAPSRVSTLCGDGTVVTLSLDSEGSVVDTQRSVKFFDPDHDPVFVTAGHIKDRFFFVSFKGQVSAVDLSAARAAIEPSWPLLEPADRGDEWRPGGYQLTTVQPQTGTLYVGMHKHGADGTHKNPAEEIWAFDTASHRRLGRTPTGAAIVAIEASADPAAKLFALEGEKNGLLEFDARGPLKLIRRADGFGDTSLALRVD